MAEGKKHMLISTLLVLILLGAGVWMLIELLKTGSSSKRVEQPITASRDLPAYHLLDESELTAGMEKNDGQSATSNASPDPKALTVNNLKGRYLLTSVKAGQVVTDEMVAPAGLTANLSESFVTAITATSATTLGGQLRVGDRVDLIVVPAKQTTNQNAETSPKTVAFEDLIVLKVHVSSEGKPADDQAVIVLAIPLSKREDFAATTVGANLVLTQKVKASK